MSDSDRNLIIAAARRLYEARKARDEARVERARVNKNPVVLRHVAMGNIEYYYREYNNAESREAAHDTCISAGAKLAAAWRAFNKVMEAITNGD